MMRHIFLLLLISLSCQNLFAQNAATEGGQKALEHCSRFYAGTPIKKFSVKTSTFELEGMRISSASPAIYDGVAYIGTDSGVIFSVTPDEIKRICTLENSGAIEGSIAVTKEDIFVGYKNNIFAAFSRADGKFLWQYETKGPIETTPIAHGKFVYFTTANGLCYCLNAETGTFKWKSNVISKASSPAYETGITFEKDMVIVGNDRQHTYAFNAKNGEKVWEYAQAGGQPLISDLRVFSRAIEGTVFALDKNAGTQDWNFRGVLAPGTTNYALANNTLVFGNGTNIIGLDSRSGEGFKWQKDLSHPLASAPIIVGDVVYANCDQKLFALDLETGKELDRYDIGSPNNSSPSFCNGIIFLPHGGKLLFIHAE